MDEIEIQKLVEKNGYCNCSDLHEIYDRKRTALDLKLQCDAHKAEASIGDVLPEEDRKYLEAYRDEVKEYQAAVSNYHIALKQSMDTGILTPMLHEDNHERSVSSLEARASLKKQKVVTLHCHTCKQQIDVLF